MTYRFIMGVVNRRLIVILRKIATVALIMISLIRDDAHRALVMIVMMLGIIHCYELIHFQFGFGVSCLFLLECN